MQQEETLALGISVSTTVRMGFPVMGKQLPADHGYALYGAISRLLPAVHQAEWLGIELISGVPWQPGVIMLPTRGGKLSLRLPAEQCGQVLPLAGKRIELGEYSIRLGIPTMQMLEPSAQLYARVVTIKKFTEAAEFLSAAERQLAALGIKAKLEVPLDEQGRSHRRVLRVHDQIIVGFSLVVHDLTDEDSLILQINGLGGRRKMGCGLFNPIKRPFYQYEDLDNSI
jgi:CRISPR-associated protein Cas6